MIKVSCVGGESSKHVINKCLSSFVNQGFQDWEMVVVLDPSDHDVIVEDPRITIHYNEEELLGAVNTIKSVQMLKCKDDDIVVFMDADDWLRIDALQIVNDVYDGTDILVSHGSWESFPHKNGYGDDCNKPYTREEFKDIRKANWRGSALRTLKFSVLQRIKKEDLQDEGGEYMAAVRDIAIMFPALEMAGFDRSRFIKEKIYIYNISGVRTVHTHRKEQISQLAYLKTLQPYKVLL